MFANVNDNLQLNRKAGTRFQLILVTCAILVVFGFGFFFVCFCFSSFLRHDLSADEGQYEKCLGDLGHDLHLKARWTSAPKSITRVWESR